MLPDTGPEPLYQHGASSFVLNLGSIVCHSLNRASGYVCISLSVLKSRGKSATVKSELQPQKFPFHQPSSNYFYHWLVWMRWGWLSERENEDRDVTFTFECHIRKLPTGLSPLAQPRLIRGKQTNHKWMAESSGYWVLFLPGGQVSALKWL